MTAGVVPTVRRGQPPAPAPAAEVVLAVAAGMVSGVPATADLAVDVVSRVPPPRSWMTRAACADPRLDPVLRAVFTADDPTTRDPDAQTLCAGCPVQSDCVAHAAGIHAQFIAGIWGGRRRGQRTTTEG